MRFLLRRLIPALAFSLCFCCDAWSQFPSPIFNNVTAQGNIGIVGALSVTGSTSMNGGGAMAGTFTGPTALTNVLPTMQTFTVAGLPAVTAANKGTVAFAQDCLNGSQSVGSGCLYVVDSTGTWVGLPSPSNLALTVGGQALFPGGVTTNQGNGSKIQLATGAFIVGHALAFDNNGNAIDSGTVPSGGTGGGGTVSGAVQNSIPFYTNAGTASTLGGLGIVNNAVLVTSGAGVPSESTSLPTGLTIPSATLTSPTLSGAVSISAVNYTGKQTFVASTLGGASINIPSGVAPSVPANGDLWETNSGLFARVNNATQGPYIATLTASGPLAVTGGGTAALNATCATCATTTNGGALTATAPMAISAGGVISLGGQPAPVTWIADSATVVHNDTYNLYEKWPFAGSGTVNSIVYHTGGTTSPAFTVSMQINGSAVTGCNTISVSSATDTTSTCTGLNTITNGQTLGLVITGVTGSPSSALVQINMTKPAS